MKTIITRAAGFVMFAGILALQVSPAFAQFTGAGSQATNWVVQLFTPLLPLACAIFAIACLTGRVNWGWFIGALIGTCIFFGRDQVVTMFRTWFGV